MIATTLFVLMLIAGVHFVYEAIVLPNLRLEQRYKIFALRDRLRRAKSEHSKEVSDEVYHLLQTAMNNTLHILPYVNLIFVASAVHSFSRNQGIRERAEKKMRLVEGCSVDEIKAVSEELNKTVLRTLAMNSLLLFVLLSPFLLAVFIIAVVVQQVNRAKGWCKTSISQLTSASERELSVFVPSFEARLA